MVTFKICGSLPAPWEDFLATTDGYPNVTIMTRDEADDNGYEDDDPDDDGWLDIVVDVDCIDLDVARLALSYALNIDNPEDIVIAQAGFCQSF